MDSIASLRGVTCSVQKMRPHPTEDLGRAGHALLCVPFALSSHDKAPARPVLEECFLTERVFPHFIIINCKVILVAELWGFDIRINQNLIFNLLLTLRKVRPIFIELFYLYSNYELGWDKPSSQKCHINLDMHYVISTMNI